MRKFNSVYIKILTEMSAMANPLNINPKEYQLQWEARKDKLDRDEDLNIDGNIINVYLFNVGNVLQLYFVHNESIVVAYIEAEILADEGIQEGLIWNSGFISPLMGKIYTEYLLGNFKYVVSDDIHTAKGFFLWCRFADDPKLQVRVIDKSNGTMKNVDSGDELKNYYGTVDMQKYVYRLEIRK